MKTKLDALIEIHRAAATAYKTAEAIGADDEILDKLRTAGWEVFVEVAYYEPASGRP